MLRKDIKFINRSRIIMDCVSGGAIQLILFILGMTIQAQLNNANIPTIAWRTLINTGYVQVVALLVYVIARLLSYSVMPAPSFGGPDPGDVDSEAVCERMIVIWENRKKQIEAENKNGNKQDKIENRVSMLEKMVHTGNYGDKEKALFKEKP